MTETTHSPLPWRTTDGHDGYSRIRDSGEHAVAKQLSHEDAALIVRAVNAHEQLVAALRSLVGESMPSADDFNNARAALAAAE